MYQCRRIFLRSTLVISQLAILLLVSSLYNERFPFISMPSLLTSVVSAAPLSQVTTTGEPCVHGEQFSDWGICLYGTIADANSNPIAGATVTATVHGKQLTAQSFVHPDNSTPTYAMDISVLDPEYLDTMHVTVEHNGQIVARDFIVFPDFKSQNQRLDLQLNGDSDLANARIWGYVIDFAQGNAVIGAQVTATLGERTITINSQDTPNEPAPVYQITATNLAALNATVGDTLTLSAEFNGIVTEGLAQVGANRQQINLLLGWECDPTNILPRNGGSFGVPRNGGSFGVPDEACFWGYGLVDGKPTAGMDVLFKNSSNELIGQGTTKLFGAENDPRFAILVTGADELDNQTITIEGVYEGEPTFITEEVNLDGRNTQQVTSLEISGIEVLSAVSNDVRSMMRNDNLLWVTSSGGGVVIYNTQTGGLVDQFLTPEGLASSIVYNVQRDQNGALWFGTQAGLSMYRPDTDSWTTYTTHSENTPIQNNFIYASAESADGILWFAFGTETSNTGLARYDPQNSAAPWTTYPPATFKNQYAGGRISDMVVADSGTLWIASVNGLTRFQETGSTIYTHANTNGGLLDGAVYAVEVDVAGNIWFGTANGSSRFTPALGQSGWMTYTSQSTGGEMGNGVVIDIAADSQGRVWVGTQVGAGRYDPVTDSWQEFTMPQANVHWTYNHIVALWIDSDDSVWFGTRGGVHHYQPATGQWRSLQATTNTVVNNHILTIAHEPDGTSWIGTSLGASSYRNGEWHTFDKANSESKLPADYVAAIVADQADTIWFGTGNGLGHYFPETQSWALPLTVASTAGGLVHSKVTSLAFQPNRTLWVGTLGGLSSYNPITTQWLSFTTTSTAGQLLSDTINSVAVDPLTDVVWIGTPRGLNRYDPNAAPAERWQSLTIASTSGDSGGGLPSNHIVHVVVASDSSLWLGTKGGGAAHYQPGTEPTWERFTSAIPNSFPSNEVGHIAIAEDDAIWFGAKNGVARYTPGGHPEWERFFPVIVPPNPQTLNTTPPVIHLAGDEKIWFGSDFGLSRENILPQRSDLAVDFTMHVDIARDVAVPHVTKHYTLTVANRGQRDATATLQLTLPALVVSVEATPPADAGSSTTNLTWSLGNLVATPASTPITIPIHLAVTYQEAPTPNQTVALTAQVLEDKAEKFTTNNQATWTTRVLDPYTADVRVALVGSPMITNGAPATFTAWIENIGGLAAENTQLTIQLPPGLSTGDALQYTVGTMHTNERRTFTFVATLDPGAIADTRPTVSATATTTTPEADTGNNSANASIPVGGAAIETLFLVAGQQMADSGSFGASPLLTKLYTLAAHNRVKGTILDLQAPENAAISAAYAAWNASANTSNLENVQKANAVAAAIKALLATQRTAYPNLRYLVFVGSDAIIPFHRVQDSSETYWEESQYALSVLPPGSVQAALAENHFLTDDYYTDFAPTPPDSQRWPDKAKVLYLPEFASGRLVESADEILAYVDAFLAHGGQIALNQNLIGADALLTIDSANDQHDLLMADAAPVTEPIDDPLLAYRAMQIHTTGGIWQSQHSNHYALGEWKTTDIAAHTTGFADSLLITVGCHAGLSVPNALGNLADTDIAQSFLAKGGAMIGTSAYAYASRLKASYSEELAIALTKEIIAGSSQPIGIALNRAKARYYSENAGWIDALDEKVLLPTTLYGLPMLEVSTTNGSALAISLLAASAPSPVVATEQMIAGPAQSDYVKMPLDNVIDPALYQLSSDGTYYTYAGNALLQEGAPIQPSQQIVPTITVGGHKIRAVLLRGASYEEKDFAPAIAESFVISAGPTQTRRNAKALFMETETGWDRAFPHSLGYADRLNNSAAPSDIVSVNLVLGAYNVTDGRYRHFTDLDLELLYSDSPDRDAPKGIDATGLVSTAQTQLTANVDANETIAEVIGLCDNGIDTYAVVDLQRQEGGQWRGICAMSATRFFLQVVDTAGNVTTIDWQTTETGTIGQDFALYLPFIAK